MKAFEPCLVQYVVGDIETEIQLSNFIKHLLVLMVHDKSTSQVNDAEEKVWVR
jgi:hypothetical protein